MKLHRFIGDFDFSSNEFSITDREISHQIISVLRLEPEERLILSDGQGREALVEILSYIEDWPLVKILERIASQVEPRRRVTLYSAVLKRENFEFVVQKATELGVAQIIPVITARTVKTGIKIDRLNKIAKEAAELAGRSVVPLISEPLTWSQALEHAQASTCKIICDPSGAHSLQANDDSVALLIGPEGGWTESELAQAKAAGWQVQTLGRLILRGETAAIVAVDRALRS